MFFGASAIPKPLCVSGTCAWRRSPILHSVCASSLFLSIGFESSLSFSGFFLSHLQRMQKRAERFNVPVSLESKKAARAAR